MVRLFTRLCLAITFACTLVSAPACAQNVNLPAQIARHATHHVRLSHRYVYMAVGDSTTAGVGGGNQGSGNGAIGGAWPYAYPSQAAAYLNSVGIPAIYDTIDGNNNMTVSADWPLYRTDISWTGTLLLASSTPTSAGSQYRLSSSTHTPITWTPTHAFDTVEFWQPKVSGGGNLTISVDGGAANTFAVSNATFVVQKLSLSVPKGIHTLTFDGTSGTGGAGAYFPLLNAFDSTTPTIQIFNAGARNWLSSDWVSTSNANPNNPKTSITNIAPDVLSLNLGINDFRSGQTGTISAFKTNMQALIDAAKLGNASVKIILIVPTPINAYNSITPADLLQAYIDLRDANPGSILIDTPLVIYQAGIGTTNPGSTVGTRINTYSNLLSLGYMPNNDGLHSGPAIYQAEGYAVGAEIKAALGL